MKKIHIQYFAILREQRGLSSETVETRSNSAQELYGELQNKFRFTLPLKLVRVSINNEFKSLDTLLQDNDNIVFIPPVAGG